MGLWYKIHVPQKYYKNGTKSMYQEGRTNVSRRKIKAFIDERGIKQSFLAERTGVSQSIMSKMLSGDYTITGNQLSRNLQSITSSYGTVF